MAAVDLRTQMSRQLVPFPVMVNPDDIRAELADPYIEYCETVSVPEHALSFETATFLLWLCRTRKPESVADYGSGWSSYVLRVYGQESGATVTSVDTDPEWLERTRTFLDSHLMPTCGLWLWNDYTRTDLTHDLILHDLDKGLMRERAMLTAVERCVEGGVVVFDDMHHDGHRMAALQACERHNLVLSDVKDLTVDRLDRYAAVAVK